MIRILKDIWYAISSPEKYRDFMNYKRKRICGHVLTIVLISAVFTIGIPAVQFMAAGGYEGILGDKIPEFTMDAENGFWIEEPVEIDEYNFLIKATSDMVYEDISDINGQYGSYEYVIITDQEQYYLKLGSMQEFEGEFKDLGDFSFSKEQFMEYTPVMYAASATTYLFAVIMDYVYYFLSALVLFWGAGAIASLMKIKLRNRQILKMSVYANTLSYLISLVQVVIGVTVPNYSIFSLIIGTGYMYFALKDYKENGMEELPPEEFGGREDNL